MTKYLCIIVLICQTTATMASAPPRIVCDRTRFSRLHPLVCSQRARSNIAVPVDFLAQGRYQLDLTRDFLESGTSCGETQRTVFFELRQSSLATVNLRLGGEIASPFFEISDTDFDDLSIPGYTHVCRYRSYNQAADESPAALLFFIVDSHAFPSPDSMLFANTAAEDPAAPCVDIDNAMTMDIILINEAGLAAIGPRSAAEGLPMTGILKQAGQPAATLCPEPIQAIIEEYLSLVASGSYQQAIALHADDSTLAQMIDTGQLASLEDDLADFAHLLETASSELVFLPRDLGHGTTIVALHGERRVAEFLFFVDDHEIDFDEAHYYRDRTAAVATVVQDFVEVMSAGDFEKACNDFLLGMSPTADAGALQKLQQLCRAHGSDFTTSTVEEDWYELTAAVHLGDKKLFTLLFDLRPFAFNHLSAAATAHASD